MMPCQCAVCWSHVEHLCGDPAPLRAHVVSPESSGVPRRPQPVAQGDCRAPHPGCEAPRETLLPTTALSQPAFPLPCTFRALLKSPGRNRPAPHRPQLPPCPPGPQHKPTDRRPGQGSGGGQAGGREAQEGQGPAPGGGLLDPRGPTCWSSLLSLAYVSKKE